MKHLRVSLIVAVLLVALSVSSAASVAAHRYEAPRDAAAQVGGPGTLDGKGEVAVDGDTPDGKVVEQSGAAGVNPNTIYVSESFDGTTFPPAGWTQQYVTGTSNWLRATTGSNPTIAPHSGAAMAEWNAYSISSGNSTRLVSPAFNLTGVPNAAFKFWMSHDTGYSTYTDSLTPQISTDGGSTWTALGAAILRYDPTCTTPCWHQHTFDLATYAGQANVMVGIVGYSNFGNNIFLDDVAVQTPSPNLSSSTKTAPGSVLLGQPVNYTIGIVNSGDGTAAAASLSDPIPAGTTYAAGSVTCTAGTCGYASGTVTWSGSLAPGAAVTVTFGVTTSAGGACATILNTATISDPLLLGPVIKTASTSLVQSIPVLSESFNGTTFPPAGWTQQYVTGTSNWLRATTGSNPAIAPHSGAAMAEWNAYSISSGNSTRLVSPAGDLTGNTRPLRFWMSHDTGYPTANDRITPQISTDGGTTWTDLGAAILRYDATCTTACWHEHTYDLSAYAGQANVKFGLLAVSAYGDNIFVDDITVADPWQPCPYVSLAPASQFNYVCLGDTANATLMATNVQAASDTIDFSVAGNTWPTTVNPASLTLGSMMTGTTQVSTYAPWNQLFGVYDQANVTGTPQNPAAAPATAIVQTGNALVAGSTDFAPVPPARGTRWGSLAYDNGKLYKMGGYDGAVRAYNNYYDIASNTWYTGTDMTAVRQWIQCAGISGKIYCAGGSSTSAVTGATSTLYIYDEAANAWSAGAAMPGARVGYVGVALGGKYYVIGGQDTTTYQSTTYIYDPATDTWSTGANMSVARRDAQGAVIGGLIYVASGRSATSTFVPSVEAYDPVANTWTLKAPIPGAWGVSGWINGASGPLLDRYLYIVGGYGADSTASNYALLYDSVLDRWSIDRTAAHQIYAAGAASDGTNFWYASGRVVENGVFSYSRYLTRVNTCATCTPASNPDFTWDPPSPTNGQTTTFTATVTAGNSTPVFNWDFGDGNTGTGQITTHTYAAAGTYTVILTVESCDGLSTVTASHDVVVTQSASNEPLLCNAAAVTFNNGIPSDWTVIDNAGGGPVWGNLAGCGEAANYTGGTGDPACASSDMFGLHEFDTELRSNTVDLSSYNAISITYLANYQNYALSDFLTLDVSTDGGSTWNTALSWNEDHGTFRGLPGVNVTVDLSAYAGHANTMLRWHYYDPNSGDFDWYAQVDDAALHCGTVTGTPTIQVAPAAMSLDVPQGYSAPVIQTLTISNTGAADLTWQILEEAPEIYTPKNTQGGTGLPQLAGSNTGPAPAPRHPYAVLYDQMDNISANGYTSQNFETAYDAYDNQGADDFIVPAGETWNIDLVEMDGVYWNGTGPVTSANVWFYTDNAGLPGTQVFQALNVVPSSGAGTGDLVLPLAPAASLPAGHYWISIQGNLDFTAGGQFGWTGRTVQSNAAAAWQNPGGGFASGCLTWGTRSTTCAIGPTDPDNAFRLSGTIGGGAQACTGDIPWLSESPTSGTVTPGLSQPVDVTYSNMGSLAVGVYTGTLCVDSNDPVNPRVRVPVTLTIHAPTAVDASSLSATNAQPSALPFVLLLPAVAALAFLVLRRRHA